jgi:hypothetical protein
MSKPAKQIAVKSLSGLGGVYDVSFGDASVERRQRRDFSKDGVPSVESDTFDDYNEKIKRWNTGALKDFFKI